MHRGQTLMMGRLNTLSQVVSRGLTPSSDIAVYDLQAGSANSLLVRVTRSNGIMFPNLTGDRAAKSELLRSWVVDSRAAESR